MIFMYDVAMQLINNFSKSIIVAVVSCSFLLAWDNSTITEITSFVSENRYNTSTMSADSVWNSISNELKLDHRIQSSQVQAEIRKILADQGKFNSILNTAGPYIYYIYQQTKQRGLPAEIALIPIIESEFNPNDHSKKGATGLWQLMPQTAHELGVKIKSGYDGRRNVVASTRAALAYFKDLGNLFKGNWYLAIAAYNCGQDRVQSAMRKSGSDSFWNLRLPLETKYYVPKLLAVAAILKDPRKYGVQIPATNNQPYFSELAVKKSVTLAQVSKSSGININTLHALNPDYDHKLKQKPKKEATVLLVPVNKVATVKSKLADSVKAPIDLSLSPHHSTSS